MATANGKAQLQLVDDYKQDVIKQGEDIVHKKFPSHILELTKLLESAPFKCDDLSSIRCELNIPVPTSQTAIVPVTEKEVGGKRKRVSSTSEEDGVVDGVKVYYLPNGTVPINATITKMIETLKPIIRNLVEEVSLLKMWVAFLIPKIEDGNNFGVGVQEEALDEIRAVESEASMFYEQMSRYYLNRAKIVAKVAKYPHIEDYRQAVIELDEKRYLSLRITLSELRNHYASLHDRINKNIDKIKKPRSLNNHEGMY